MIYDMARWIASDLVSRKFPVTVTYGATTLVRRGYDSGYEIFISRADRSNDRTDSVRGSGAGVPSKHLTRELAVVVEFRVALAVAGAMQHEHEHACDDLVDAFLVSLVAWCSEARAFPPVFGSSGYAPIPEDATQEPGVRYQLEFSVPRGVFKRDYEGLPTATATLAACDTTDIAVDTSDGHEDL